jgi:signal transduction histidine kinase
MAKFSLITPTSNLLYQRYRFVALAVYTAVLLAGLVDWVYGGIGPRSIIAAPESYRFGVFVMAVLWLMGLELGAVGQASFGHADRIELIPFFARLGWFIGAGLVTDLDYSQMLFLPILVYSYLAVSKRFSYCLAMVGVATLFGLNAANVGGISPPPPALPAAADDAMSPAQLWIGRLIDRSTGVLITLLFTVLLARTIAQATQAEQKLTGLLADLETSHRQLQSYAARVGDFAATEERNRLARDIHDSLGHHLAAINIQLEKANAYRDRDANRSYEAVTHAQRTVQDALKDVRASVSTLRQSSDAFSFHTALGDLIRRMEHHELALTLQQTGDSDRYSKLKLMILYRVIQEGLTNVHKHGNASQVTIALDFGIESVSLDMTDNGQGFDVVAWQMQDNPQTSHGLIGLQERLSLVDGSLDITSQPQLTRLSVRIPQISTSGRLSSGLIL